MMSDSPLETIDHAGCKIEVWHDPDATSPRDYDGNANLVLSHRRYDFPNDAGIDFDDYGGWDEVRKALVKDHDAKVILPVFMLDHSGVAMRTYSFNDPWDSGQLGFIYATGDQIDERMGWKRVTAKRRKVIETQLSGEVGVYGSYVNGECYGYVVLDAEGEEVDACWGYVGDTGYMLDEARAAAEAHAAQLAEMAGAGKR